MMRLLISAAVNQIGFFALARAAALGMDVRATRRRRCFQTDPASITWLEDPDAAEAMVHCGPLAPAALMVDRLGPKGLKVAVAFSSASIHFKAGSSDPREAAMVDSLRKGEEAFAQACARHGVSSTILRPTMIYGCGLDENVTALAAMMRRLPALPVPWGANGLRQPVHADDLADLALRAVQAARPGHTVLDAPGGERLGYRAMLRRIGLAINRPAVILPVPGLVGALQLARRAGFAPRSPSPEQLARMADDLSLDGTEAARVFGWAPRGFLVAGAADIDNPAARIVSSAVEA